MRGLSVGTSSHGGDEPGHEPFEPRSGPVPPRDVDLAPIAVDGVEQSACDERRVGDDPVERPGNARALREARLSIKPGSTACTFTPRGASSAESERENASCACFEAEYGPSAKTPATETTFTTCEPAFRPGRNASVVQIEPR